MRTSVVITACVVCVLAGAARATADGVAAPAVYGSLFTASPAAKPNPWRVTLVQDDRPLAAFALPAAIDTLPAHDDAQQARPRVAAVEYSEGYKLRAKIHRIASFATLPLFATEVYLGQSVYNGSSEGRRSAHVAVGAGIGALFAVNSVTGIWNLWEGRKDPTKRKVRIAHGLLMLASDAGFLATAAVAPHSERDEEGRRFIDPTRLMDERQRHRTVALTSIGIGTVGYLVMLLGGR